jgi:hypothetical protein
MNLLWMPVVFGGFFVIDPWLGGAVMLATVAIYALGLARFETARSRPGRR